MQLEEPESVTKNLNNPSKEIFQSRSGIYEGTIIGPLPYAVDIADSLVPNTGVASTTPLPITPTLPPGNINNALNDLNLSNGNRFVDDMLVFNPYIHYVNVTRLITFDPQGFLQQSLSSFNAYNFSNRTP